ncbi:MAG: sugar ABC transporter permease [Bacillaceae bacterium]|nr:sugar ABC transporter permease [Bacillaceae bacterium]
MKYSIAKRLTEKQKTSIAGYLFISPFFLLFAVFGAFPMIFSFYLAFQKWNGFGEMTFVGFQNFNFIFIDPVFWKSIYNTVIIGLLGTVPQLIAALILAVILNSVLVKMKSFFRVAYFVPNVTSIVAVAIVFTVIFNEHQSGIVNATLGLFGLSPVNWQTSEWGVKIAIATMIFWRWVGYNSIIFLAGLQSIPKELYEAAEMDGAKKWQQFLFITVPMLKPIIIFVVFTATIGSLQIFAEPLIFSGSGFREESITIVLYLWREAFSNNAFGTASATAVSLFLLIIAFSVINVLMSNRLGKTGNIRG